MRAVVQRVSRASVRVDGLPIASIDRGLLVLVGVGTDDGDTDAVALAEKVAALRVFRDTDGKMNCSVGEVGGSVLVVSQFTLLADVRRGRRPSFVGAAEPVIAEQLVEVFASTIAAEGIPVSLGRFGAHMEVELVNDGPVTIPLQTSAGRVV
ncbi:MAG: D-aminoacyl-tRNA deacylase [Acidimicrobiia bacterium]